MITSQLSAATSSRFAATVADLEAGELYPTCPRCRGHKLVFAYTDRGSDFSPSRGEYFTCPLCSGTGEAPADDALAFIEEATEE